MRRLEGAAVPERIKTEKREVQRQSFLNAHGHRPIVYAKLPKIHYLKSCLMDLV